jgi:3-phosphoinositide dependent protein kinase-1
MFLYILDILISSLGHVKIADFGTATIYSSDESPRNSFVGTQDYVSPEVLAGDRKATKACDLWAVGCMIYQMLTGRSPFREPTEYLTFEAILGHCKGSKPLQFPVIVDEVSKNIILALLIANEEERLGCGCDDVMEGYSALKSHAFFASIHWNTLLESIPLYIPDISKFPLSEDMRDGALHQWLLEGEPTFIAPIQRRADVIKQDYQRQDCISVWSQFLHEGESQVFTSSVYKRKGLFSKRRQLVLTDRPRLIYIDPSSMELKGEVPWTKAQPVTCIVVSQTFHCKCTTKM